MGCINNQKLVVYCCYTHIIPLKHLKTFISATEVSQVPNLVPNLLRQLVRDDSARQLPSEAGAAGVEGEAQNHPWRCDAIMVSWHGMSDEIDMDS